MILFLENHCFIRKTNYPINETRNYGMLSPVVRHDTGLGLQAMRRGVLRGTRSERDSERCEQLGQTDPAAISACLTHSGLRSEIWTARRRHGGRSVTGIPKEQGSPERAAENNARPPPCTLVAVEPDQWTRRRAGHGDRNPCGLLLCTTGGHGDGGSTAGSSPWWRQHACPRAQAVEAFGDALAPCRRAGHPDASIRHGRCCQGPAVGK